MAKDLKLLSNTMRDWSTSAGDHHWLAHLAIEELIKYRNLNNGVVKNLEKLLLEVDTAFVLKIPEASLNDTSCLRDLNLMIGLIRVRVSKLLRMVGSRPQRLGENYAEKIPHSQSYSIAAESNTSPPHKFKSRSTSQV